MLDQDRGPRWVCSTIFLKRTRIGPHQSVEHRSCFRANTGVTSGSFNFVFSFSFFFFSLSLSFPSFFSLIFPLSQNPHHISFSSVVVDAATRADPWNKISHILVSTRDWCWFPSRGPSEYKYSLRNSYKRQHPGEIEGREVELDSEENPGEIKS